MLARLVACLLGVCAGFMFLCGVALADADAVAPGVNPATLGLQPIQGAIPQATAAPGESKVLPRDDGSSTAVPSVRGRTKTFSIVERAAPWTLKAGMTVMANTYNGVVPGPVLQVDQGDTVVINYTNDQATPDTIHLHGIHGAPVAMDGVPGISQSLVPQGGHYRYTFVARDAGTFLYHTHDAEAMLNSGLYGAIVVLPKSPAPVERGLAHDFVQVISSWSIQGAVENEFTLNGKEYPSTKPLEVKRGERFRIRWINISGENFHTMHTHGHDQLVIARDAQMLTNKDMEDTVLLGPGQRADVVVSANAQPGTWMIHCHIADHIQNNAGMPDGLITVIHYAGTPDTFFAMNDAMMPQMTGTSAKPAGLQFGMTLLLGAIAGLTIFLGLPVARARKVSAQTISVLNALAIGILLYLVVEIARGATTPIAQAVTAWHGRSGPFPWLLTGVFIAGLLLGLVALGSFAQRLTRKAAQQAENPIVLSLIIAIGIGAHNFGEGLAIGASAASGATGIALALIAGFALHNATEGFGVAAPLVGRYVPSWAQIGLAGLIAGGPTFLGTVIGYQFYSPVLAVFFLATAVGALIFVIGELWSVLKKTGLGPLATTAMTGGFLIAFATELFLDVSSG
ncbi:MAG: multicopper oxidase domain-containing protein [Candidatus Eremiobacteraeota bacterium]|nr:multicopper oxidase domain-containing protein [Candidatus Eremiobacteraeota bacterium]